MDDPGRLSSPDSHAPSVAAFPPARDDYDGHELQSLNINYPAHSASVKMCERENVKTAPASPPFSPFHVITPLVRLGPGGDFNRDYTPPGGADDGGAGVPARGPSKRGHAGDWILFGFVVGLALLLSIPAILRGA